MEQQASSDDVEASFGAHRLDGAHPNDPSNEEDVPDMNIFSDGAKEENVPQLNLNDQLEDFRQQWRSELQSQPESPRRRDQQTVNSEADSLEEEAKALYLQGVEMEERHMLMEAIGYYKKALHLVPDIESKMAPLFAQSPRDRRRQDSESSVEGSEVEENLVLHFENLAVSEGSLLCQPNYEQRATHISVLPVELVLYILQWVVSSSLDLRSLENVSLVCRGLYLCARDERIWKMACERVWGVNLGKAKKFGGSWRQMMVERPHPWFDGCYISRMAYIRQGEQNMDQFYRPIHYVQYYRYMRFFPDGVVMMLVSPEEPVQSLPKLRHKTSRAAGLMVGGYKLTESRVTCVMKRAKVEQPYNYRYRRQRRAVQNETDISYYVEFELTTSMRRPNAKLVWMKYTTRTFNKSTGEESLSEFELSKTSFPAMVFSHVSSFSTISTEPLE